MSLALLFNRTKPKLDAIELDATLSESHAKTATVTRNPVERGSDVTDHVHIMPDRLKIEGVISQTPDVLRASFDPRFGGTTRAKSAWAQLKELQAKREPFEVFTSLQSYTNMVISSLETTRTADTTHALRFTATLDEIEIASVSLVENLAADVADLAAAESDLGTQGTGPG